MKSLLIVVSLLFINDQVTARKSILPKWLRVADLSIELPLSVLPIVYFPTVTTGIVLDSPALAVTGVVCSVVASCGTYYFYNKWRTKVSKKVSGYRGQQIIYHSGDGGLKRGKVISYNGYGDSEFTEMNIAEETTPIIFKDIVAKLIPNHRDVGREIEVLTEDHDHQAINYVGHVIDVFDNGFYELELLVKTDFLPDPLVVNETNYDLPYIDIEPRRIIINKNVSLADGGFKFARRGNRTILWARNINQQLQQPQIVERLLSPDPNIVAETRSLFRQREHELLLKSGARTDVSRNSGQDQAVVQ